MSSVATEVSTIRLRILDFVRAYWAEHSKPPMIRDIAQHIGKNGSTIFHHLQILGRQGYVVRFRRGASGVYLATNPPLPEPDRAGKAAIMLLDRVWREVREGRLRTETLTGMRELLYRDPTEILPESITLEVPCANSSSSA